MDQQLPLAEVRAVLTSMRKAKNFNMTWLIFEGDDKKQMADFVLGPSGEKVVLLSIRPVPPDWEPPEVDPNQEAGLVDHATQLQNTWDELVARMTSDADLQP